MKFAIPCQNQFQFTPLHERQLFTPFLTVKPIYFNSRLCMRGNYSETELMERAFVFQFTPLHERQLELAHAEVDTIKFQFTPLHERQQGVDANGVEKDLFQFTPLHERQQGVDANGVEKDLFQFTPLHERQLFTGSPRHYRGNDFNSRLCMRGNEFGCIQKLKRNQFQFTPLHERQRDCHLMMMMFTISIHASA